MSRPPVALSIAGSDPSGGAGVQADLKTFCAHRAYGMTAITALTAQNTRGVSGVHVVPCEFVDQQLTSVVEDVRIDAVKIGMLADAELVELVGSWLARSPLVEAHIVLDPVMVATSGDRLLDEAAVEAMRRLLPLASVITPNVPEAAVLLGCAEARDTAGLTEQAQRLRAELGAARVLLKGGHLTEGATDVWVDEHGVRRLTADRVDTRNTHGTGCTLSSALAALRPQRPDWWVTAQDAKAWLTRALRGADRLEIGSGHGPVDHLVDQEVR